MTFVSGCTLRISGVAPYRSGLELQPLVHSMDAFPKPESWSAYLRRTLLELSEADAKLIDERLGELLVDYATGLRTYLN